MRKILRRGDLWTVCANKGDYLRCNIFVLSSRAAHKRHYDRKKCAEQRFSSLSWRKYVWTYVTIRSQVEFINWTTTYGNLFVPKRHQHLVHWNMLNTFHIVGLELGKKTSSKKPMTNALWKWKIFNRKVLSTSLRRQLSGPMLLQSIKLEHQLWHWGKFHRTELDQCFHLLCLKRVAKTEILKKKSWLYWQTCHGYTKVPA